MKTAIRILAVSITMIVLFTGCKKHDVGAVHPGQSDDPKSFSGATHKEGTGITLLPETKQRLGIDLTEVKDVKLPKEVVFTARVFATEGNNEFFGSGILPAEKADFIREGTAVQVGSAGHKFEGSVAKVLQPISTKETEVVVRFAGNEKAHRAGSFVTVTANIPSDETVASIPREALIRGSGDSFVYVQNGEAYLRTVVQPGREVNGSVEIKDGLLEGDLVVTKGAMDLWLVELRAVKGGQGCCPAPAVKKKAK